MWPVEVIGDEGYLLVERVERVADYPPAAALSAEKA
jgi:hypothetical protein